MKGLKLVSLFLFQPH